MPFKYNRRQFINHAFITSMISLMHPACLFEQAPKKVKAGKDAKRLHLIKNIRLLTQASFQEMEHFYADLLGLSIVQKNKQEITFQAGLSSVTFIKTEGYEKPPFYHFAFNIPQNKIRAAREWQAQRSDLVPTPERLRDPDYPIDVRHFRHWNAHSVFFYDPAGNVLEYIARHDLENSTKGDFSTKDILNISEIAFVVDDQEAAAKFINKNCGLPVYPKGASFWWSMGDEHGLLLAIPKRIWAENTANPKQFAEFKTEVSIISDKQKQLRFPSRPYFINMEA